MKRIVTLVLVLGVLGQPALSIGASNIHLLDLQNKAVDPLEAPAGSKAIVVLFLSTDCPVSNRYAPEIQRLSGMFATRGVVFWLVYPNPSDGPAVIRDHLAMYGYHAGALRDPQHALVKLARATVTPEAAVFDAAGRLIYHGRIDDLYVDLGIQRQAPTTHDLEDALTAIVSGKEVLQPTTQAVGCFIADFVR